MLQGPPCKIDGEWGCTIPGTAVAKGSGALLHSLLQSVDHATSGKTPHQCLISSITVDSRKSGPGALFVALRGQKNDGHDFVSAAVAGGCSAVLFETGLINPDDYLNDNISFIEVRDSRTAYSRIAENIFCSPSSALTKVAVTGTNGKTTISYLLEHVLRGNGKRVGVVGTVNYRYHDRNNKCHIVPSPLTTPEPLLLQGFLRAMVDAGVEYLIMEVSSHGLEQGRVGSMKFDIGAFTNLSRDHLDYHRDMETYFKAKTLLFTKHMADDGVAVITFAPEASGWSRKLEKICAEMMLRTITCGDEGCDISTIDVHRNLKNSFVKLKVGADNVSFSSPLVGDFNILNLQTCFALSLAAGLSPLSICSSLADNPGAPGRMQRVPVCAGEEHFRPAIFVDYAHTPDALQHVLKTARALPGNKLYCVFGCGGDRDKGKRPLMGEVAAQYADVVVVTDDNPRSEEPAFIRDMIVEGLSGKDFVLRDREWLAKGAVGKGYVIIPERHMAISMAAVTAGPGDIVIIAGKGHEDYQITAAGKGFFDDSLVAATAMAGWNMDNLRQATGGSCSNSSNASRLMGSICTDSRKVKNGDIFVALKGERFDAFDYVEDVMESGASCLILNRPPEDLVDVPYLLVKDTEKALGDLAAYRRRCCRHFSKQKVIAITGSSGKTTVKEMCAAIFRGCWPDREDKPAGRVLKTEGNFNNSIGLPLSLLPLEPKHKVAILELGMNHPGEIARLTEISDPDIACILNVHGAHLAGLGTIDGVAEAKGELFQGCGENAVLVVNGDDSRVAALADRNKQAKIFFGSNPELCSEYDVFASGQREEIDETVSFFLHIGEHKERVVLKVPGLHNVNNGLAAAAIAHAAGVEFKDIAAGLEDFTPLDSRMEIIDGLAGSRIIRDCYNANPASMAAGLRTLAGLAGGNGVAVLGDMLELGDASSDLHREIGRLAGTLGIKFMALVGSHAGDVAAGVEACGVPGTVVRICNSREDCSSWLHDLADEGLLGKGSYILVKGSRGMRLEKVAELLQAVKDEVAK